MFRARVRGGKKSEQQIYWLVVHGAECDGSFETDKYGTHAV